MYLSDIYLTKVYLSILAYTDNRKVEVYLVYTDKYTEKSKYTWLIPTNIQKSLSILGLY